MRLPKRKRENKLKRKSAKCQGPTIPQSEATLDIKEEFKVAYIASIANFTNEDALNALRDNFNDEEITIRRLKQMRDSPISTWKIVENCRKRRTKKTSEQQSDVSDSQREFIHKQPMRSNPKDKPHTATREYCDRSYRCPVEDKRVIQPARQKEHADKPDDKASTLTKLFKIGERRDERTENGNCLPHDKTAPEAVDSEVVTIHSVKRAFSVTPSVPMESGHIEVEGLIVGGNNQIVLSNDEHSASSITTVLSDVEWPIPTRSSLKREEVCETLATKISSEYKVDMYKGKRLFDAVNTKGQRAVAWVPNQTLSAAQLARLAWSNCLRNVQ